MRTCVFYHRIRWLNLQNKLSKPKRFFRGITYQQPEEVKDSFSCDYDFSGNEMWTQKVDKSHIKSISISKSDIMISSVSRRFFSQA
jgi:hypothetical protein